MSVTGNLLGKYEIIGQLGQGGMAQVFKARQPHIERLVAIKVMASHLSGDQLFVEKFRREAQRLGQLRHPNIVSVLDFDIVDDTHFLVMDYVAGPTLGEYLESRRKLPLEEALRITSQIADALNYAHEKGVFHCDLKPANVMFLDQTYAQVVLTDFGIARLADAVSGMAQTSTVIGTASYMSPEQAQGMPLDGRTDIYSLGIMLYEMVTGNQPYEGDSPVSVLMKQVVAPLPDLSQTHPDTPVEISQIIQRAMAKKQEDRYRTAGEMRQAIELALARLRAPSSVVQPAKTQVTQAASVSLGQAEHTAVTVKRAASDTSSTPISTSQTPSLPKWLIPAVGIAAILFVCLVASAFLLTRRSKPVAALEAGSTPTPTVAQVQSQITSQPPTATPETIATAAGSAPIEVLDIEPNRFGSLIPRFDSQGQLTQAVLLLDRVPALPEGSQYVLWIGNDEQFISLGKATASNGIISQVFELETSMLIGLKQALVTIESQDSTLNSPSDQVAFTSQLSEAQYAEFRQLVAASPEVSNKPYLFAIYEQARTGFQHQQMQVGALESGNQSMGRAHAEHVINILEGKSGENFGDRDGNGSVENPGDDVGVRQYINQTILRVQAAAAAVPQTRLRQKDSELAVSLYQANLNLIDSIVDLNIKLLAAQDGNEATQISRQARDLYQELLIGQNSIGGLWLANFQTASSIEIPMIKGASGPSVDAPLAGSIPAAEFSQLEQDIFSFRIFHLPSAPAAMNYVLWANQAADGDFQSLGEIPADQFEYTGTLPADFSNSFSSVVLSLEITGGEPTAPNWIVLSGPISSQTGNFYSQITTPGKGALIKAEEQAALAADHMGFMLDSLEANQLEAAKGHAEHVINILEGEEGSHFGDVNGDGSSQNPGDGVGVLGYLNQLLLEAQSLANADLTDPQKSRLDQLQAAQQKMIEHIESCYEAANKIISSDTAEEALNNAQNFQALVLGIQTGVDQDRNGITDPQAGEGGLELIRRISLALGNIALLLDLP